MFGEDTEVLTNHLEWKEEDMEAEVDKVDIMQIKKHTNKHTCTLFQEKEMKFCNNILLPTSLITQT